jgi:hypothetical protein
MVAEREGRTRWGSSTSREHQDSRQVLRERERALARGVAPLSSSTDASQKTEEEEEGEGEEGKKRGKEKEKGARDAEDWGETHTAIQERESKRKKKKSSLQWRRVSDADTLDTRAVGTHLAEAERHVVAEAERVPEHLRAPSSLPERAPAAPRERPPPLDLPEREKTLKPKTQTTSTPRERGRGSGRGSRGARHSEATPEPGGGAREMAREREGAAEISYDAGEVSRVRPASRAKWRYDEENKQAALAEHVMDDLHLDIQALELPHAHINRTQGVDKEEEEEQGGGGEGEECEEGEEGEDGEECVGREEDYIDLLNNCSDAREVDLALVRYYRAHLSRMELRARKLTRHHRKHKARPRPTSPPL